MARILRIDGAIDPHVHLRDLDWSYKATFLSETTAAVAGGYTAVLDMPNTPPTTISIAALQKKLATLRRSAVCDWGVYAGASQSNNCHEFAEMAAHTCGLKIFNNATTGDLLIEDQELRDEIYRCWNGGTIAVHAEGSTILELLSLVRKYRKHTHFLHISSAQEIEMLREAKVEGLPVSIGVCPHHLFLSNEDEPRLKGYALMKPGLKKPSDCEALWKAIEDGTVDVIESDHAPHTISEKESEKPPFGVPGLETNIPLMLTAALESRVSLDRVVQMLSSNVREIWGIPESQGSYTLVDLDVEYTIERGNLHTKCGWSPFEGKSVRGKVLETWIHGTQAYDYKKGLLTGPGFGKNLFASEER